MQVAVKHYTENRGLLFVTLVHMLSVQVEFTEEELFCIDQLGYYDTPIWFTTRIVDDKQIDTPFTARMLIQGPVVMPFDTLATANECEGIVAEHLSYFKTNLSQNTQETDRVSTYEL